VDVIARYRLNTDGAGKFDLTAAGNYNEVVITDAPGTTPGGAALFSQQRITSLERGTPRWKGTAAADWSLGNFGATVRASYYGNVVQPAPNTVDYFNTGKNTLIDLEGRVKLLRQGTLAIGANNLFDDYPDAVNASNGNNYNAGATAFLYYSPFGFNGRYLYARFSLAW
jgi:iron complex outermembrane receptor protein